MNTLGHFQIYFATADYLSPTKKYLSQYGKVKANGPCHIRNVVGYEECAAACGNFAFAKALYRMQIGTPVIPKSDNLNTRNWLASNLIRLASATLEKPSELINDVIRLLEPTDDHNDGGGFGAKYLVIIKSERDT